MSASTNDRPTVPEAATGFQMMAGQRVGHFEVLEMLGSGGMGRVWVALDTTLGRKVALKVLNPAPGVAAQEQMLKEARALAQLGHPNVVAVHEVGDLEGLAWMAMELAEGQPLDVWLAAERRPWREIVRMFAAAGRGLDAAHQAGLVHRDFKPSNVMVREDGRVQLLDFGLVLADERSLQGATQLRASVAGTPAYLSPEQLCGEALDARSDQFSFCVALYEAVCGVLPFGESADDAQLKRMDSQALAAPPAGRRVPRRLLPLLKRGLAPKPEDRFPSMGALLAQLRGLLGPGQGGRLVIATLSVLAGALIATTWLARTPLLDCPAEVRAAASLFTGPERAAFVAALTGDATEALARLDSWAVAYTRISSNTCEALASQTRPEALVVDERACLSLRRRDLRQLTHAVRSAGGVDAELVKLAVDELVPPEACLMALRQEPLADFERLTPCRRALREGRAAYLEGAWDGARRRAQEAQSCLGGAHGTELDGDALRLEAVVLERIGDLPRAQARYRKAIDLTLTTPSESLARNLLGLARVVGLDAEQPSKDEARTLWSFANRVASEQSNKELTGVVALSHFALASRWGEATPEELARARAQAPAEFLPAVEAWGAVAGLAPFPPLEGLGVAALLEVGEAARWAKPSPARARALLSAAEAVLAPRGAEAALARLHFAQQARLAGEPAQAEQVARAVLASLKDAGEAPRTTALARYELAAGLLAQQRSGEARPLITAARTQVGSMLEAEWLAARLEALAAQP